MSVGLLTLAGCIYLLAACSSPPAKMPEVVWQNGRGPSGPYEDSKWVKAARKADAALNAARNAGDYRMSSLENISSGLVVHGHQTATTAAKDGEYFFNPGPTPSTVTSVTENKEQKYVEVTMCSASDWYVSRTSPTPPKNLKASQVEYDMYDFGDGVRIESIGDLRECTLKDPAIGYFKPAPDPYRTMKPSDIRKPLDG